MSFKNGYNSIFKGYKTVYDEICLNNVFISNDWHTAYLRSPMKLYANNISYALYIPRTKLYTSLYIRMITLEDELPVILLNNFLEDED